MSAKLTKNALTVLQKRGYLARRNGEFESPEDMFRRAALTIAAPDLRYGTPVKEVHRLEERFFEMMSSLEFLAGAVLMNAGRRHKMLSACFVLPIEDSLESIFKTMRDAALVSRMGGGLGMSFSRLRPRHSLVASTGGVSSGPVSYLRLFDHMGEVINEGCSRRVAMLAALRIDHPDIMEFISSKTQADALRNFNISVAVTDDFMKALKKKETYPLIDPHTRRVTGEVAAEDVWRQIAEMAWKSADPGLLFVDRMNAANPIPHLGKIESTNVCGEQPLLPYESCNLGNINLAKFSKQIGKKVEIDWQKLRRFVRDGVHFLDNVIDVCEYPIPEIERVSKTTRKIGLGVMGWADLLVALGISYASEEAVKLAEKVSKFIQEEAREASVELGEKRGSFPGFAGSRWENEYPAMRNSTVNTVAPTGTISILANCSSSVEPIFALAYVRKNLLDLEKTAMYEMNPAFEKTAKKRGFYSRELMEKISREGSVQRLDSVPEDVKKIFVTAHDISWEWHVKMQAAWQRYVDSGVSKTINMPHTATAEDVASAFLLAYETGCKGITVYRDKSKDKQVLNIAAPAESEAYPHDAGTSAEKGGERFCPECA
jgi:ribonucleoside-diphosphate reductase alpha chain